MNTVFVFIASYAQGCTHLKSCSSGLIVLVPTAKGKDRAKGMLNHRQLTLGFKGAAA